MYRSFRLVAFCSFLLTSEACSLVDSFTSQFVGSENISTSTHDVAGVWSGTVRSWYEVHGANAIRKIVLNISQNGTELRGTYECSPGNVMCHNRDVEGSIRWGTIKGRNFWCVIRRRPDYSLCVFKGYLGDHAGSGNMWCYTDGGSLIETGKWELRRQPRIAPTQSPTAKISASDTSTPATPDRQLSPPPSGPK